MSTILIETGLTGAIGSGIVFVEAGLAKLRNRELVPGVVANYRLLPDALVAPVAALLPAVELALGLGLMASVWTGGALRLLGLPAAALFVVFAAAMAINIRRGRRAIDCGCGRSQLRQPLRWGLVARNIALAVLVAMLALSSGPGETASPVDIALALVAGTALFLIFLLFNALAALAASPLASGRS
jgi:hypothetical protein